MLPPATWSPDGPREGGDNNLARQLYFSQVLPPGGVTQPMRGEVGQGDVEDELRKAEEERRELHRQLEALNLQHREAQGKLQSMQQQQQQQVSPSQLSQHYVCNNTLIHRCVAILSIVNFIFILEV